MDSYTLHSVSCSYCGKLIGNSHAPEKDQLPTICLGCGFLESIVAKDLGGAVSIEEQDYRLIAESDVLDTPDTPYSFMRKQRIDKHARANAKAKKLIS